MSQSKSKKPRNENPIGIFDSGVGGLTVAKALMDLLPNENLVYLGDTERYSYGSRPLEEVRGYALQIMEYMLEVHNVKSIVVACNTASAALSSEDNLKAAFREVPIMDVILPGLKSLVKASEKGKVGVIGTTGTISSGAYQQAISQLYPDVEICLAACPGLVEFVERNETDTQEVHIFVDRLLAPIREAKVDALLLACTHYPFLAKTIGKVLGRSITLVSSADETAFSVLAQLEQLDLLNPNPAASHPQKHHPQRLWISTGESNWFQDLAIQLLGSDMGEVQVHRWD